MARNEAVAKNKNNMTVNLEMRCIKLKEICHKRWEWWLYIIQSMVGMTSTARNRQQESVIYYQTYIIITVHYLKIGKQNKKLYTIYTVYIMWTRVDCTSCHVILSKKC